MSSPNASASQAIKLVVIAIVLLLLFVAVGLFYYFLTRAPEVNEVGEKSRNYLFSIYGFEGDLLRRPSSVAVGPNGDIYVADTGKKRIVVFDKSGNFRSTYGDFGEGPLQVWEPLGIAVAQDGRSYVIDKQKKKIVVYDVNHKAVKSIATPEYPLSARVANGSLFVTMESGVVIADLDGNLLTGYIKRGKKAGEFDRPGAVAIGKDGTLYVADSLNYRVQAISSKGKPMWQYGQPLDPAKLKDMTTDTGQRFGLPASIAIDDNGYLYVVDGLNSEVAVLDSKGGFVEKMGDVGHDDGKFYYPDGIDYASGRLVIADKYNDRVEVFSVPVQAGVAAWTPYAPWALLLLIVPLPFLLLRRKPTYVMSPEFLGVMVDDPKGGLVADALKSVAVTPEVAETARTLGSVGRDFKERSADGDSAARIAEEFGVERRAAETLDVAARLRGKRVLLAEDESVKRAAEKLGIPVLTFEELLSTLHKAETAEEATEQEVADDGPEA